MARKIATPAHVHTEWNRPRYSRNEAETMMCLLDAWRDCEEHEAEQSKSYKATHSVEFESVFIDFRSEHGSYDLRHTLEQMAPDVTKLWDSLSDAQRDSYTFDWEFCPDVLRHAVDWETHDGNCLVKLHADAKDRILAHRAVREEFGKVPASPVRMAS